MGALGKAFQFAQGFIDDVPRQRRANRHFPRSGFHSTRSDFPAFDLDKSDLGIHIGTRDQANTRLAQTRAVQGNRGELVLPLRFRANNPLNMPDIGEWHDPVTVLSALGNPLPGPSNKVSKEVFNFLEGDAWLDELADLRRTFDNYEEFYGSPEVKEAFEEMRGALEGHGIDSIRYRNDVEVPSFASPVTETGSENLTRLDMAIQDADDPFLREALEQRVNQIMSVEQPANRENSFIVLRPNQVRSTNAAFRDVESDNLMGAIQPNMLVPVLATGAVGGMGTTLLNKALSRRAQRTDAEGEPGRARAALMQRAADALRAADGRVEAGMGRTFGPAAPVMNFLRPDLNSLAEAFQPGNDFYQRAFGVLGAL